MIEEVGEVGFPWGQSGGAELPVTNIAIALALGLLGPGDYSLDHVLHIRLPRRLMLVPGLVLIAIGVATGLFVSSRPQPGAQPEQDTQEAKSPGDDVVRVPERPSAGQESEENQQSELIVNTDALENQIDQQQ